MMLLLTLTALLASAVAQDAQSPAASYGPPAPPAATYGTPAAAPAQPFAAPAPVAAPEVTALTAEDGTQYLPYPYSYSEPGFSVQTGYEGYLVPYQKDSFSAPGVLGLLATLLPFKPLALKFLPKFGVFAAGFLFLLLIGGAFTTAVCAFTPICTISFLGLGLTRNTVRSYMTPDRLTQTTAFVLDAIDKYKDFSKKVSKEAREARSKDSRRRRR